MDGAILVVALATVVSLYVLLWTPDRRGAEARVWVDSSLRHRLSLAQPATVVVHGALGRSVIEVRDGRVRVASSPGRHQICVRAGWLAQAGDAAVCLPNRVVLEVHGGTPRFDAINF